MAGYIYKVIKQDSKVKGFCQSESGQVFIDNIKRVRIEGQAHIDYEIDKAFMLGEHAVFYTLGKRAYIKSKDGSIKILKHRHTFALPCLNVSTISGLLKLYNGFTAYYKKQSIIIEIWDVWAFNKE